MPAAAVASRAPSIGGMSGAVFGARGETVVAMAHPRLQRTHPFKDVHARDKSGHEVGSKDLSITFWRVAPPAQPRGEQAVHRPACRAARFWRLRAAGRRTRSARGAPHTAQSGV